MSSTNKTPNYSLPQFVPTDKPTWLGDINAAMLAIDTAMADNHTIAEGANTTAAGAEAKVQAAVDTANEAKVDSAAALQTATSATGVAQNALTAATSATQTANAASTQAQQAAGTAAQASAVATAASNLANQTAAGLTEFEHMFTVKIPNKNGTGDQIRVNPAILTLIAVGGNITENEAIRWKVNGKMLDVAIEYQLEISDNVYLVIHTVSDGMQEVGIKTKSGTVNIVKQYEIIMHYSYEEAKTLIANNPNATRLAHDNSPQLLLAFNH